MKKLFGIMTMICIIGCFISFISFFVTRENSWVATVVLLIPITTTFAAMTYAEHWKQRYYNAIEQGKFVRTLLVILAINMVACMPRPVEDQVNNKVADVIDGVSDYEAKIDSIRRARVWKLDSLNLEMLIENTTSINRSVRTLYISPNGDRVMCNNDETRCWVVDKNGDVKLLSDK